MAEAIFPWVERRTASARGLGGVSYHSRRGENEGKEGEESEGRSEGEGEGKEEKRTNLVARGGIVPTLLGRAVG